MVHVDLRKQTKWVPSLLVGSGVVAGYALATQGPFFAALILLPFLSLWDLWLAQFLADRVNSIMERIRQDFEKQVDEIKRDLEKVAAEAPKAP